MNTLLPVQSRTFYEMLASCKALDLRDKRGKVHCAGLVLVGVLIGLHRNRDGVLSSIHRSIKNTHSPLCAHLGIAHKPPVSRAQLPLVLKKIDVRAFSKLLFAFSGTVLNEEERQWFAADGKELRGSIAKGCKRGEVVVQVVGHDSREVYGQAFYNGRKASERPCIRGLLQGKLGRQKITLDALHLIPVTLKKIAGGQGHYLIGLKENQKELYQDMVKASETRPPVATFKAVEKGHGRIDKRTYKSYAVADEFFDERWTGADFQTLVRVERATWHCKTKAQSTEVAYYLSNATVKDASDTELFTAVRGHWSIETSNHIRDVTLKEDRLKTKEPTIAKVMACCRTVVLNLFNKLKLKNRKAKLDEFADDFQLLLNWLTEVNLL